MKPQNPYIRLLTEIRDFCKQFSKNPKIVHSASMKKSGSYDATWLHERIVAAGQLGYDTKLEVDGDTIKVLFVERLPAVEVKYSWRTFE